ncbi:hypothetical protein AFK68_08410 [Hydrocoleum sp. CS-953]|uniref:hypothetical protein n=1 Tax=Hydrocoleum sp. CS-953 TaxID=1671698 RepID=UPI000B9A8E8D|nr:hypothetical protein [Hydrocoleum sp. CS-953]OZH54825.1 hypothetical protein AFK68_08410 [Hydrocoleum sp. CS-953]
MWVGSGIFLPHAYGAIVISFSEAYAGCGWVVGIFFSIAYGAIVISFSEAHARCGWIVEFSLLLLTHSE